MTTPLTISGTKIYIGRLVAQKSKVTLADFADVTWTEIQGHTNFGQLGDSQQVSTQSLVNEGRDVPVKGNRTGSTMENSLANRPNDPGQKLLQVAQDSCGHYEFKVEYGGGCECESVATISVASPGVVTVATGHGLEAGSVVIFSTDGALPGGISTATPYYVLADGLTPTAFKVSATNGGAAIATTGTSTGVHKITAVPVGKTVMFRGLVLPGSHAGGESNALQTESYSIQTSSNLVKS